MTWTYYGNVIDVVDNLDPNVIEDGIVNDIDMAPTFNDQTDNQILKDMIMVIGRKTIQGTKRIVA